MHKLLLTTFTKCLLSLFIIFLSFETVYAVRHVTIDFCNIGAHHTLYLTLAHKEILDPIELLPGTVRTIEYEIPDRGGVNFNLPFHSYQVRFSDGSQSNEANMQPNTQLLQRHLTILGGAATGPRMQVNIRVSKVIDVEGNQARLDIYLDQYGGWHSVFYENGRLV